MAWRLVGNFGSLTDIVLRPTPVKLTAEDTRQLIGEVQQKLRRLKLVSQSQIDLSMLFTILQPSYNKLDAAEAKA